MDVIGTCECGHDAKMHEGIDGRMASKTPCTGTVLAPTTGSGFIQRTMQCTCDCYTNAPSTTTLKAVV